MASELSFAIRHLSTGTFSQFFATPGRQFKKPQDAVLVAYSRFPPVCKAFLLAAGCAFDSSGE